VVLDVPKDHGAFVSKSEQSKKAGFLNFFLDCFHEYEGTTILQNVDAVSHPIAKTLYQRL
jgi:hypothetical protein